MDIIKTISLIKSKNRQAEKHLFMHFAPFVLTLCRRYAAERTQAEDYMQECFMHVFSNIEKYDVQKGEFQGWLHRVCTNKVLQLLRKTKREITMVFPEHLPEQELTQSEFEIIPKEQILHAIQQLPNGYREVFNLYIFEGWSHKEIGTALEIAETTSRSQLTRAKKLLKTILQKKSYINYGRQVV